ncbi:MAG: alpha-ribazole phosphatase family protein [Candidatus Thiodiazotropha sp. DIVDIV]
MSEKTIIDLMRHGEPVGGRRYRGQIDDPLSEKGWNEMRHSTSKESPWDVAISSPLKRCSEFAVELSNQLKIDLTFDERLKEVGFGDWEGHSGDELRARDPNLLSRFYHDPITNRPAGAESLVSFSIRVQQAVNQVISEHAGKHILILTHAGVIRTILTQLLNAPLASMYRLSIGTASISRIQIDEERPPTILFVGKTAY